MGSLLELKVVLGDHIADNGEPGIQLVRNLRINNAGLRNNCDSRLGLAMRVALTLWVIGYNPSL